MEQCRNVEGEVYWEEGRANITGEVWNHKKSVKTRNQTLN